ncbi:hypothetical protein EUZ85_14525 [Hahella sp. KA22]|uniref:hypothetical protein n=1 Tax=Hahella sp. KA22 TaxID=1628392 RepID=UPI000FDDE4F6|nr:hypothetical protein [Hahella sp. KA22]AZZ91877.1 hypothetical protein ENC22_11960 [Hahella sp. KA22]QAY55248.1 hypothetical protein EUZ85_14525 [Hahella sp. KA22]
MGGNALKDYGAQRLSVGDALRIGEKARHAIQALQCHDGAPVRAEIVTAYRKKETYGDIDIVVSESVKRDLGNTFIAELLGNVLGDGQPLPFIANGGVASFGAPLEQGGVFQVDLLYTPACQFDFALSYFSWNDAGNLIGRVAHKMGMKFGHNGLWLPFRDGDYLFTEVLVTRDFDKAVRFLGFDIARWKQGFDDLTQLYQFISASKYFDKNIYLLENRSHNARVRDAKRPTYTGFLNWLREAYTGEDFKDWPASKTAWLPQIFAEFPEAEAAWGDAEADLARQREIKRKFNGELVSGLSGLTGTELGALMQQIRHSFEDKKAFDSFILSASESEVEALVVAQKRVLDGKE